MVPFLFWFCQFRGEGEREVQQQRPLAAGMQVGRSLLLLAFLASLSPSLRENAAQHSVNAWVQIAVSYSAITLLGWEMILVRGCENVAGKLRQE